VSAPEFVVSAKVLQDFCARLFVGLGVPPVDAEQVAGTLVDSDLRGVHSHGANLMSLYATRIRSGHIKPVTEVTVVGESGSSVQLDGGLGLGQISGIRATDLSVERAKEFGMSAVSVRELTHLGALGYYTRRAAEQGFISLVVQNGPAFVPPFGGVTGMFSTNPFSYAFPASEESPVVFDIATTAVAGNKILLAKKRGDREIPAGWASDSEGRPTTDTQAASIDHLQWFGGHKGYGIAFFVEVMAGVLANSSFGRTEHTESPVHGKERVAKGALFLSIDPASFPGGDQFGDRMDTLIRDVRSSEPAEGFERVLVPGDIERRLRDARLQDGIPLAPASVEELNRIAAELQVTPLDTTTTTATDTKGSA
jgi:LDH2 family malate/lactate/ureidoglycolate dehydrogenase